MILVGAFGPRLRAVRDGCRRRRSKPTPETSRFRGWHRQPRRQHRAAEADHDHDQRSSIRSSCALPGPQHSVAVWDEADSALAADQSACWLAYEDRNLRPRGACQSHRGLHVPPHPTLTPAGRAMRRAGARQAKPELPAEPEYRLWNWRERCRNHPRGRCSSLSAGRRSLLRGPHPPPAGPDASAVTVGPGQSG